jgi:hypothetical protein
MSRTAARTDDHRSGSQTSDEGFGPRADHNWSLIVYKNDVDATVGQHALREFVP